MTFKRSFDYKLIGEIMRHPKLYQADDFSPKREDFQPWENPSICYVTVHDGEELLGLYVICPQNFACWEVHTRLLPHSWGDRAAAAGREFIQWVWSNVPVCRRLVTSVPATNRGAIKYAEKAGLVRFGTNPKSYQVHGSLVDQVLLGVSKPE